MVAAESVAAVIVEPVLGEGGFVAPPPEFFPIIQEICRRHKILLIADEVQTGILPHGGDVCVRALRYRSRYFGFARNQSPAAYLSQR